MSYLEETKSNGSWFWSMMESISDGKIRSDATEMPIYSPALGIDLLSQDPAGYQFNWAHWVNLTDQLIYQANGYSGPIKPLTKYVNTYTSSPFNKPPPKLLGSESEVRWIGRSYLAFHAPSPAKIIFLNGNTDFPWDIDTSNDEHFYQVPEEEVNDQPQQQQQEESPPVAQVGESLNKRDFKGDEQDIPSVENGIITYAAKPVDPTSTNNDNSIPPPPSVAQTPDSTLLASLAPLPLNSPSDNNLAITHPLPKLPLPVPKTTPQPDSKSDSQPSTKKKGRRVRKPQPDESILEFLDELRVEGREPEIDKALCEALITKSREYYHLAPYLPFNPNKKWNITQNPSIILTPESRYIPGTKPNGDNALIAFNGLDDSQTILDLNVTSLEPPPSYGFFCGFFNKILQSLIYYLVPERFHPRWFVSFENSNEYGPTSFEEYVRRMLVSIEKNHELLPLFKELTFAMPSAPKDDISDDIFSLALNTTISKMILKNADADENFHFQPKAHTTRLYAALLPNKTTELAEDISEMITPAEAAEIEASLPEAKLADPLPSDFVVQDPSYEQIFHSKFVFDELRSISESPKYFHEVSMKINEVSIFKHADWRFFNKELGTRENVETLHRMFRAWSRFTFQEGVVSWLAHGTLLGWYWNGLSMPYDEDMDIQMPAAELDRLARKYNNTLIVDDPKYGGGRYILEVAPPYVERTRGNGNNVIDARFIDLSTGSYIDLTGLSQHFQLSSMTEYPGKTEQEIREYRKKHVLYGCKNNHFYTEEDLFPMRLTLFEGAPIYVPNNWKSFLEKEYQNWTDTIFENHKYVEDIRMWVNRRECRQKIRHMDRFRSGGLEAAKDESLLEKLEENRFCGKDEVRDLYERTKKLTAMHQKEMEIVQSITHNGDITIDKVDSEGLKLLAPYLLSQPDIY